MGIPWRLVVSDKTIAENKVEVKRRDQAEIDFLSLSEVVKFIKKNS